MEEEVDDHRLAGPAPFARGGAYAVPCQTHFFRLFDHEGHRRTMSSSPSIQKETALLATAVTASVVAAGLAIKSFSQARRERRKFQIPKALKSSPYSAELKLAVRVALEAGCNMFSHCDNKGTAMELKEHELGIETKGHKEDFCTAIDIENEQQSARQCMHIVDSRV